MDATESHGHPRRWWILATLSLSLVLIGLDTLILNTALPRVQMDLHASSSQLQWVIDAYAVAFGGLLLLAGGLADRFGRRRVLLAGLTGFLTASLAAAFAGSSGALVAARMAMGVFAALIMPATLAIIKAVFPPHEQARAIGIWSGAAALGVPLGPTLAGFLLDHFWWGSLFLINVPLSALAIAGAWAWIPLTTRDRDVRLDWWGGVLSVSGLTALVFGLVQAPAHGWQSVRTLGTLALGAGLMAGFLRWEAHTSAPMMPLGLFRHRRFSAGLVAILATSFSLYAALLAITMYWQSVRGHDPLQAGLRMLAVLPMVVSAAASPHISRRFGLFAAAALGLVVQCSAMATLASVSASNDVVGLVGLGLLGLGVGLTLPAATDAIITSTPPDQAAAGSAVADVGMQAGGSLGVALAGSALLSGYRRHLPNLPGVPDPAAAAIKDGIVPAQAALERLGPAGRALMPSVRSAFLEGMATSLHISGLAALLGMAVTAVLLFRNRRSN